MGFLEIIGGVLTGGATGLIGSLLSKGIGLFEAHQKRKDRMLDYEHELKLLDRQVAASAAETENALAIANAETSANLREASYAHDSATGRPHRWVVSTLRLVRPALTLFLLVTVFVVYMTTNDFKMKIEIISSVLFMASSAVTWWFGDRSMGKRK
jgi:hypothetical protein